MLNDNMEKVLERHFDGEGSMPEKVARACEEDPALRAYSAHLQSLRSHAAAQRQDVAIQDAQFNAFMDGVRAGTEKRSFWSRGLALASVTAASLIISAAAFYIVGYNPSPVEATEVEMVSTELNGDASWHESEDGIMTVWVSVAEDDL
jgi:hypothetical protein